MDKAGIPPIDSRVDIAANGLTGTVCGHYQGRQATYIDVEYVDANGAVFNKYFDLDQVSRID